MIRAAHDMKEARRRKLLCLFLCGAVFLSLPSAARAQDDSNQPDQARLSHIENELQTLSRAVFKGETPPPGSLDAGNSAAAATAANNDVRLSQIESSLRDLTGTLERQNNDIQTLQKNILAVQAQMVDLQSRPVAPPTAAAAPFVPASGQSAATALPVDTAAKPLQAGDAVAPPAASPAAGTPTPPGSSQSSGPAAQNLGALKETPGGKLDGAPATDPAGQYAAAYTAMHDQDYDTAERGFTDFLDRYPDHKLAPNAQYWLGETYLARKNYEQAARAFATSYQKYPKGAKAPDSLLKLAESLNGLGKKPDACLTLTQLKKEYPTATPILSLAAADATGWGCQP
jgi:tol-pal system protein YbgF